MRIQPSPRRLRGSLPTALFLAAAAALAGCTITFPGPGQTIPSTDPAVVRMQAITPPADAPLSTAAIAAIVAAPDRSAADRDNDARRHPADTLAFIGVHPGWNALDVSTGGGYTTELLARAIGSAGTVYAQSQPRDPNQARPAAPEGGAAPAAAAASAPARRPTAEVLAGREKSMQAAGVFFAPIVYVGQRFDEPVPASRADGGLNLVTLMFNYHDFGYLDVDRAKMNRAIFKSLKHGGLYVIADHAGRPGTGISEAGTLHRVEDSFVKAEVEAAGFKLAASGDFLRNPADPRDQNAPPAGQAKDEFVLKFVKP
jgi:predicted methyltransferase